MDMCAKEETKNTGMSWMSVARGNKPGPKYPWKLIWTPKERYPESSALEEFSGKGNGTEGQS